MVFIKYPHIRASSKGIRAQGLTTILRWSNLARDLQGAAGILSFANGMIGLQYWIHILESFSQARTPRYSPWSKYRMNGWTELSAYWNR